MRLLRVCARALSNPRLHLLLHAVGVHACLGVSLQERKKSTEAIDSLDIVFNVMCPPSEAVTYSQAISVDSTSSLRWFLSFFS